MNFQFYNFSIFKRLIFGLTFFIGFLAWGNVMAAEHYIRADATGSNNGADWTNAFTAIPASPTHGDTYYLADGTYGDVEFGDESYAGTSYVNILKATSSAHGSAADWNNSYGDGQALFATVGIQGPYFVFDGVTGSGKTGYGIKVGPPTCSTAVGSGRAMTLLRPHSPYGNHHVYVRHAELEGTSEACMMDIWDNYGISTCGVSFSLSRDDQDTTTDIFVQNNYIHTGSNGVVMRGWENSVVSGNYFSGNYGSSGAGGYHDTTEGTAYLIESAVTFTADRIGNVLWNLTTGAHCTVTDYTAHTLICTLTGGTRQTWSIGDEWQDAPKCHNQFISPGVTENISLHGNTFEGPGWAVGAHNEGGGNANWNIYNNILKDMSAGFVMGESGEYDGVVSFQVHHNTFINMTTGRGAVFTGLLTDVATQKSYAYNNLFYNSASPRLDNLGSTYTADSIVHDNNAYLACTGTINSDDETNPQRDDDADDPFVDSANGDYRLNIGTLPINNGKTDLGATYALDYAGTERGASPDIGAYEYTGAGDVVAPASPTGLSVT